MFSTVITGRTRQGTYEWLKNNKELINAATSRARNQLILWCMKKNTKKEIPILAIELDGKAHFEDEIVKARDAQKNAICAGHHLELIRVENSYAGRYTHMKEILMNYFNKK